MVLLRKARVIDPQSAHHNKVVDLLIEDGIIKNIAAEIVVEIHNYRGDNVKYIWEN